MDIMPLQSKWPAEVGASKERKASFADGRRSS